MSAERDRLAALLHAASIDCMDGNTSYDDDGHRADADRLIAAGVGFPLEAVAAREAEIRATVEGMKWPDELVRYDEELRQANAVLDAVIVAIGSPTTPRLDPGEQAACEFVESITSYSIDRERLARAVGRTVNLRDSGTFESAAAAIADAYEADHE